MGDMDDLVAGIGRRGATAEERRIQAVARIRFWTGKRVEAHASKNHIDAADCESKIAFWTRRLRSLEERMSLAPS